MGKSVVDVGHAVSVVVRVTDVPLPVFIEVFLKWVFKDRTIVVFIGNAIAVIVLAFADFFGKVGTDIRGAIQRCIRERRDSLVGKEIGRSVTGHIKPAVSGSVGTDAVIVRT